MCITKKATKNTPAPEPKPGTPKKKTNKPVGKKFKIPTFASLAGKRAEQKNSNENEKSQTEENKGETQETIQKSVKEETRKEEVVETKVEKKVEMVRKMPNMNLPSAAKPSAQQQCLSGLSGAKKRKVTKMKFGMIDKEELSINNDKTEYLENAQLTKLMSHADVKALMGGQMAQGEEGGENVCQDTVEEVDSEMQDIAFSPLLAGIPREEDKGYGLIPNPTEQKKAEPVAA